MNIKTKNNFMKAEIIGKEDQKIKQIYNKGKLKIRGKNQLVNKERK